METILRFVNQNKLKYEIHRLLLSLKYTWSKIFRRAHDNGLAICIRSSQLTRMVKARPGGNLLYGRKLPEVNTQAGPTDTRVRNKLPAMRIFQSIKKNS
jgi:hypothetical protein